MVGQKIAHYEITAKIGAGGMGEVYRARDTKLSRDVALKLIPEIYLDDPQRLGRFQREAQLLASLNHPNIGAIYGLEEDRGKRALVLELVEGEDLSQLLSNRVLGLQDSLEIALQIAEALESAHEKGVIHRDLKPANVKIAPDGKVKVLDFGLAKALSGDTADAGLDPMESPTLTAAATGVGMVLGTAAYMSPEQARGKPVDRRADIWSFGVVLFEMLTRKQLFSGETVSDTLASVIKDLPDWELLSADTPPAVADLIVRCLQKDPRRRLQSIGEARIVLDDLLHPSSRDSAGATLGSGAVAPSSMTRDLPSQGADDRTVPDRPRRSRGLVLAWLGSLVAVALLAGVGTMRFAGDGEPLHIRKFLIAPANLVVQYPSQPALSPDGRHLAYFADSSLWIRDLNRLEAVRIPETEAASAPFWSPDGAWLAYGTPGKIHKVPAAGGTPVTICDVPFLALDGACWGDDDVLTLAPNSGALLQVSSHGGDPVVVFPLGAGESDYHTPTALPGGRGFFFTTHREQGRDTIEVFADGKRKQLLRIPGARLEYATFAPLKPGSSRGHLIYHRMRTNQGIWAVPIDLTGLEFTGDPFILDPEGSFPSLSRDGSLLYCLGSGSGMRQLVMVDGSGEVFRTIGQPQYGMSWPALSPNGEMILVAAVEADNSDIWMHSVVRGTRTRVTFGPESDWYATWIPGGDEIAFTNGSAQSNTTYRVAADGTGQPELLLRGYHPSFTPGGEMIAFNVFGGDGGEGIFVRETASEDEPRPFLQSAASERGPEISPDGRYIVYMSNETGTNQVYLTTFPRGTGKWQVSAEGGAWPIWSRDGRQIIYRSGSGGNAKLMRVSVQYAPSLRLGTPELIFESRVNTRLVMGIGLREYEVTEDPEVFIMLLSVGEEAEQQTRLVYSENWYEAYRRGTE